MRNNKKSSSKLWLIGIGATLLILGIWSYRNAHAPVAVVTDPSQLAGIQTTITPWPPELLHLRQRLKEIGLPALSAEGTALHIHQHLDIFIDGTPIIVPAEIGINNPDGFISPIHVHDTTGVIHVESPVVQTFTLGQFFDIWGVKFSAESIGGYDNGNGKTLKVFVNGVQYTGDPREIALQAHQEIAIAYGTDAELPVSIPSSYAFGPGL